MWLHGSPAPPLRRACSLVSHVPISPHPPPTRCKFFSRSHCWPDVHVCYVCATALSVPQAGECSIVLAALSSVLRVSLLHIRITKMERLLSAECTPVAMFSAKARCLLATHSRAELFFCWVGELFIPSAKQKTNSLFFVFCG